MCMVVHIYIKQDCFYSLMDKMVLLQIVAFIEIYEHTRMNTRTHTQTHTCTHAHTQSWRDGELERKPGNGGGQKAKEIGAEGNL